MLHVFIRSADKYIHHCRGTESNRRKIKRVNPETHTHTHTQNRQSLYRNGDMQRASQLTLKWIQARKQGVEDWETKNRDGNPADKWNDPIASLQRENSEAELQGSASMMLRDGPLCTLLHCTECSYILMMMVRILGFQRFHTLSAQRLVALVFFCLPPLELCKGTRRPSLLAFLGHVVCAYTYTEVFHLGEGGIKTTTSMEEGKAKQLIFYHGFCVSTRVTNWLSNSILCKSRHDCKEGEANIVVSWQKR